MSLNIKNERVHALAREAARRTGRSQTSVIEEALNRYLVELSGGQSEDARRQRLHRLVGEVRAVTTDADRARTQQLQDDLYDERGLPT